MCVLKASTRTSILDISILTDDFQYVEFEFSYMLPHISKTLAGRIRQLFVDFTLDSTSQIIVSDIVSTEDNPFYVYLMFLHQHMQFNINKITLDNIVRRIGTYHRTYIKNTKISQISKRHFNALWIKLIEMEKCPWISKQIEYDLQMKSKSFAIRKRRCRMALYYMVVRQYLMSLKNRSIQKSNSIKS